MKSFDFAPNNIIRVTALESFFFKPIYTNLKAEWLFAHWQHTRFKDTHAQI